MLNLIKMWLAFVFRTTSVEDVKAFDAVGAEMAIYQAEKAKLWATCIIEYNEALVKLIQENSK
jgi:hypothetical protein